MAEAHGGEVTKVLAEPSFPAEEGDFVDRADRRSAPEFEDAASLHPFESIQPRLSILVISSAEPYFLQKVDVLPVEDVVLWRIY